MKIFLDYDGTLVDTMHKWLAWINKEAGTNYTMKDVLTYDWVVTIKEKVGIDTFNYFTDAFPYTFKKGTTTPIRGSQAFVAACKKLSKYDLSILTATHDKSLEAQKDRHINYHYEGVHIIHDTEKHKYAIHEINGRSAFLIDDKAQGCEEWIKAGGYALLFTANGDYPYATLPFTHPNLSIVDTYDEALSVIEKVINIEDNFTLKKEKISEKEYSFSEIWEYSLIENSSEKLIGIMKIGKNKNASKIESLHIDIDFRRKGLGKKMIASLISEDKSIYLDVLSPFAKKFYEQCGFTYDNEDGMSIDPLNFQHCQKIPSFFENENEKNVLENEQVYKI